MVTTHTALCEQCKAHTDARRLLFLLSRCSLLVLLMVHATFVCKAAVLDSKTIRTVCKAAVLDSKTIRTVRLLFSGPQCVYRNTRGFSLPKALSLSEIADCKTVCTLCV
jgi:hypothetical protein